MIQNHQISWYDINWFKCSGYLPIQPCAHGIRPLSACGARLNSVDCLLLHCPEYQSKAGVDMTEIYSRISALTAQMCFHSILHNASRHISNLVAHLLHAKLWDPRNIQKSVPHFIQGDAFEHLESEVAKGRIATLLQLGIKTYQHATVLSDVTDASPGYRACCVSQGVLGTLSTFCRILKAFKRL